MRLLLCLLVLSPVLSAHEPGMVKRSTSLPLSRCDDTAFEASLPVTRRYLEKVFHALVAANGSTFQGDLAPDLFCVGPALEENPRAMSDPQDRSIVFWTGLILLARNDAHIAGVMGHEMAHVTMRHRFLDATPVTGEGEAVRERMREIFHLERELPPLQARLKQGGTDLAAVRARHEQLASRITELHHQVHALTAAELGPEAAANWEEVEADEVGLELYLRAGFRADEYPWRYEELSGGLSSALVSPAERRRASHEACGFGPFPAEPPRGAQRYAANCWTVWNLSFNEFRLHGPLYARLRTEGVLTLLPGEPTLLEAQDEIRRVLAAQDHRPTKR